MLFWKRLSVTKTTQFLNVKLKLIILKIKLDIKNINIRLYIIMFYSRTGWNDKKKKNLFLASGSKFLLNQQTDAFFFLIVTKRCFKAVVWGQRLEQQKVLWDDFSSRLQTSLYSAQTGWRYEKKHTLSHLSPDGFHRSQSVCIPLSCFC